MPLFEEIFLQFSYQEAATKRCLLMPFRNLGIGISASASSLESALASALQKNYFCLQNFFLKIEYLCSVLCFVMASVPLCYKYSFLYDFLFIHTKASIGVIEKGYLRFWRHRQLYFEKVTAPDISAYFASFPREASRVEFFLYTLAGLPGNFRKSSLEQLFCREPVSACFSKKELHSIRYLRNFPEF